jgi:hypothetical protein
MNSKQSVKVCDAMKLNVCSSVRLQKILTQTPDFPFQIIFSAIKKTILIFKNKKHAAKIVFILPVEKYRCHTA